MWIRNFELAMAYDRWEKVLNAGSVPRFGHCYPCSPCAPDGLLSWIQNLYDPIRGGRPRGWPLECPERASDGYDCGWVSAVGMGQSIKKLVPIDHDHQQC